MKSKEKKYFQNYFFLIQDYFQKYYIIIQKYKNPKQQMSNTTTYFSLCLFTKTPITLDLPAAGTILCYPMSSFKMIKRKVDFLF